MAASTDAEALAAATETRPAWLENLFGQVVALSVAAGSALLIGAVIIVAYGENPLEVYGAILRFSFATQDGFAYVLAIATPLIFSALAVAVCFKAGLFNIGVEGQFLVGMVAAAWAALNLDFIPGPLLMWTVLLFGALGGMAWASVPAVLKVRTGAHEVVTTIMMNGIAVFFVGWALQGPLKFTIEGQSLDLRTDAFPKNALVPDLGHLFGFRQAPNLSWLLPLALVAVALVWVMMRRTQLGYEARAVGASPGSAKAGGISIGAVQIQSFLISGALAGLVGMQQLLADAGYLSQSYQSQLGFTGIAVAFLGRNNPVGIVFAALVWGVLARGESALQVDTGMPREFIILLQGILILSVVIAFEVAKRRLLRRQLRREGVVEHLRDVAAEDERTSAPEVA
jgi:ABC-type uncharacterized transport system permease subunit